jgi:hypothetical protein
MSQAHPWHDRYFETESSLPPASNTFMGVVDALNIRIGTPVESTASLNFTAPAESKKTRPGLEAWAVSANRDFPSEPVN